MVLTEHKKFYDEIFKIKGFLESPFLMFGFQELTPGFNPRLKDAKSFKGLLHLMGVKEITVLDYEDKRADIHFDMNYPFNQNTNKFHNAFNVVADVGCLEHVFNTAQAIKNCMDAVKVGGLYFLHTHIAGYCKHGFHTFNSDMLKWVVKNNGFEIIYCHYSDKKGIEIPEPANNHQGNAIIWLVARRIEVKDRFHIPIQDRRIIHESRKTIEKIGEEVKRPPKWATGGYIGEGHKGSLEVGTGKAASNAGKKLRKHMNENDEKCVLSKGEIAELYMEVNVSQEFGTGGYIGEGHDPVDLSNQNLNL